MSELTEKPDDMTDFEWMVYQDLRDQYLHRVSKYGGRWIGSPWDIAFNPHIRRACNRLVRKGYFTIDEAMYYYISTPIRVWQERQDKIDAYFLEEENYVDDMRHCPLITGYEFLENTDISIRYKCTWAETGETVILDVRQRGQGIPHWNVIKVEDVHVD